MALPSFDTALRILALEAVHNDKDWHAVYRRVCRWYSQTFHTPLHLVFDLDEVFVLQHYYEQTFGELDDPEWRSEVRDAIETPAEKAEREADEAAKDQELIRRSAIDLERLNARRKAQPTMGSDNETLKKEYAAVSEKLRETLSGLPADIEPAKERGDKVKASRVEQIDMPGFAKDAFEVSLGEAPELSEEQMGLKMPPAPPKKRKTRQS